MFIKISKSSSAVSSDVSVLLQGIKIIPFESPWSTMTRIELCLSTSGRSVIKSIEQLANGLVNFAGDLSILKCWQVPHPDMSLFLNESL